MQGSKTSSIPLENDAIDFKFPEFGAGSGNEALANLDLVQRIKVTAMGKEKILTKNDDFVWKANENALVTTGGGRNKLRRFPYPKQGSSVFKRVRLVALATSSTSGDITDESCRHS